MLRQLLIALILVFGIVLFAGCERDGVNGTTDRDEVIIQPDDDAVERDGTTMPDETTTNEYELERGTQRDEPRVDPTTPQDESAINGQADPNAM
jgi:hypothetical protein